MSVNKYIFGAAFVGTMACASFPAHAAGGYMCDTSDGSDIGLYTSIGRVNAPTILGVTMIVDGNEIHTSNADRGLKVGQSWIDNDYAMIEIVHEKDNSTYMKLVTQLDGEGVGKGTMEFGRKTYPVECGMD